MPLDKIDPNPMTLLAMISISLMIYGGLAGGISRPALVIDWAELSPKAQTEVVCLIDALKASPPPSVTGPGLARDAMGYVITIHQSNGQNLEFEATDATQNAAFAALLQWIQHHAAPDP
jgi:hypothetical protein